MPDARYLIRRRQQQTEDTAAQREIERSEQTERTRTGSPASYEGRNPGTGQIRVRSGDRTIDSTAISNSELTPGSQLQVLDTSTGSPSVNFPPSVPDAELPPKQPSEDLVGTLAVLLDAVIDGDAPASCRNLQDVWALFAIVQYVKAARCMVLFSFPNETGAPVPYACPRYEFGQITGGVWTCSPTPNPNAEFGSFNECSEANPVSCPGNPFGEGVPIEPGTGGVPEGSGVVRSPNIVREILAKNEAGTGPPEPGKYYIIDGSAGTINGTVPLRRADFVPDGEPLDPADNPELLGTFVLWFLSSEFFDQNGRFPRCGDVLTTTQTILRYDISGALRLTGLPGGNETLEPPRESNWQIINETRTYNYQSLTTGLLSWVEVSRPGVCGDFDAVPPLNDLGLVPVLEQPDFGECPPAQGQPTTIERQFWVGGHLTDPVFLTAINEEEEYEYYGTLTADGYIVTLKYGREAVGSTEQWCKIEQFITSNFVDWRTVEYNESKALQPPIPTPPADALVLQKNDRVNITRDGIFEIDPNQQVTGAGNVLRPLSTELLIRPEAADIGSLIDADLTFTPEGGPPQIVPVSIYRVVDVIPTDLDEIDGQGCVEVGGVEFAFSPLVIFT